MPRQGVGRRSQRTRVATYFIDQRVLYNEYRPHFRNKNADFILHNFYSSVDLLLLFLWF